MPFVQVFVVYFSARRYGDLFEFADVIYQFARMLYTCKNITFVKLVMAVMTSHCQILLHKKNIGKINIGIPIFFSIITEKIPIFQNAISHRLILGF